MTFANESRDFPYRVSVADVDAGTIMLTVQEDSVDVAVVKLTDGAYTLKVSSFVDVVDGSIYVHEQATLSDGVITITGPCAIQATGKKGGIQ